MIKILRNLADWLWDKAEWLECSKAKTYAKFNKWLDSKKVNIHHCNNCICEK